MTRRSEDRRYKISKNACVGVDGGVPVRRKASDVNNFCQILLKGNKEINYGKNYPTT